MAKEIGLSEQRLGRRNIFSPSAKVALMVLKSYTGFSDRQLVKSYTGFSDRQLVEHLNGNIHYQMFCGIMIDPSFSITNYKIVSTIRNEMAARLDIESLQEILAAHWKQDVRATNMRMWQRLICPTARKEKGRLQEQGCSSVV